MPVHLRLEKRPVEGICKGSRINRFPNSIDSVSSRLCQLLGLSVSDRSMLKGRLGSLREVKVFIKRDLVIKVQDDRMRFLNRMVVAYQVAIDSKRGEAVNPISIVFKTQLV